LTTVEIAARVRIGSLRHTGGRRACWGSVARCLGLLATVLRRWDDAGHHFEDARTMKCADRRPALGRPHAARSWRDAARARARRDRDAGLALLGEARDIAVALGRMRLAESVDRLGAPAEARAIEASAPQGATFRREGEFWTLAYEGSVCRLKDARGLHYIAALLRHPGEEFHARDLVGSGGGEAGARDTGSAGPVIDPQARSEYVAGSRTCATSLRRRSGSTTPGAPNAHEPRSSS
jgi:hypothetical protein